jgi:hypothetical protein
MSRTCNAVMRVCFALWLTACAEGYEADPFKALAAPSTGGGAPVLPGGGSGAGSTPMDEAGTGAAGTGVFTGESCRMGDNAACTCADGVAQGIKICRYDVNSPTQGSFSECQNCMVSVMAGNPGDVSTSGSGGSSGVSGGSSGVSGGSSGVSGGSSGTGASGTGGSTTPPSSGGCSSPCTQSCFPVGVLPCCTAAGRCGCTWAPGAYCL